MIDVRGVTKTLGGRRVLDEVSLTIPKGGLTTIVGPNGAGKSTLLAVMSRLLPMDAGDVLVDGRSISATSRHELARTLAVLRQENHFTTRLRVRELVGFGRFPHRRGRRLTVEDRDQVDLALRFLDMEGLADRYLDELSGGQRQRAYVAMVLAQQTDYVLLDEPLNNLDIQYSVSMMQQFERAAEELERTIVMVVHDLNFALAYARNIIAVTEGRIAFSGPAAEFVSAGAASEIFHTPIQMIHAEERTFAYYYRNREGA